MSKFFKSQRLVRTNVIPLDPDFKCPACGTAEKNVVLFCSRCWQLLPPTDQADLRRMTIAKQDTKSKIAKCVAYLEDKITPRDRMGFKFVDTSTPTPPAPRMAEPVIFTEGREHKAYE